MEDNSLVQKSQPEITFAAKYMMPNTHQNTPFGPEFFFPDLPPYFILKHS